jgi:hypothetical protein
MPAHREPPPRLPRDSGSTDRASGIEHDLPSRLARVVPADFANTPTLSGIGSSDAFVTSADDIAGIETGEDLAFRLALLAEDGSLLTGAKAVIEFDAPDEGLACPVLRTNPGFAGRGRTAGGASEFVLPNLRVEQLRNVPVRLAP